MGPTSHQLCHILLVRDKSQGHGRHLTVYPHTGRDSLSVILGNILTSKRQTLQFQLCSHCHILDTRSYPCISYTWTIWRDGVPVMLRKLQLRDSSFVRPLLRPWESPGWISVMWAPNFVHKCKITNKITRAPPKASEGALQVRGPEAYVSWLRGKSAPCWHIISIRLSGILYLLVYYKAWGIVAFKNIVHH